MRLWATSCLHLSHATNDSQHKKVADAIKKLPKGDSVALCGDLVDSRPEANYPWLEDRLKGREVFWVEGNHDPVVPPMYRLTWHKLGLHQHPMEWDDGVIGFGFKGWNYPHTPWADHHPIDGPREPEWDWLTKRVPEAHLLMTHFPMVWNELGHQQTSPLWKKILGKGKVRTIICGHVHKDYEDSVISKLILPSRTIKIFNVAACMPSKEKIGPFHFCGDLNEA